MREPGVVAVSSFNLSVLYLCRVNFLQIPIVRQQKKTSKKHPESLRQRGSSVSLLIATHAHRKCHHRINNFACARKINTLPTGKEDRTPTEIRGKEPINRVPFAVSSFDSIRKVVGVPIVAFPSAITAGAQSATGGGAIQLGSRKFRPDATTEAG